jgi:glycosyltransferase involved in cell wall biosynthesis
LHARAPREEKRNGLEVLHPRYPLLPKIGMTMAQILLARAVRGTIERLSQTEPFDLIDAHYLYPDGVAAALVGRRLGKPVVITARGTDVTLIPRYRMPRAMIRWAARQAAALITVSRALKDDLVELGISPERITVLRNGVDLQLFRPGDRPLIRRELGLQRPTLLSVGHLIPRKGHELVIRALSLVPALDLIIIGSGSERAALAALAKELGISARVRFVTPLPQVELARYYSAADALVLASNREGWANVLLEAMACGTPVIATDVGGASEIVTSPEAGTLVRERTLEALARGIDYLFSNYPDRADTRRHAEQFSWAATTKGQIDLFSKVLAAHGAVPEMRAAGAG